MYIYRYMYIYIYIIVSLCIYNYIYIYTHMYIYGPMSRVHTPPPHMVCGVTLCFFFWAGSYVDIA